MLSAAGLVECVDKVTWPTSNTCIENFVIKLPSSFNVNLVVLQSSVIDRYAICLNLLSSEVINSMNSGLGWSKGSSFLTK